MAIHHGDIGMIEKALKDYKLKAQEMNVGINYMALDDERRRQELLLRELREIEEEIASPNLRDTKLPHLASAVGTELDHNTKCLQYLTGISELERSIGEVAAHFAERSVELSDPSSLHKDVVTYKTLTDNVKSCWTYVDQLTTLAQIHLKASAEYHQFFHEANEIEAKLDKQLAVAQSASQSHKDVSKITNEIRGQVNIIQNLGQRSVNLAKRSETIVPIRLRLGGVAKGVAIRDPNSRPVMVRAMVSLTGPDYRIKKGEELHLIDNRQDSHLWRVQTSSGIVEVPSICFWLMDSDKEATERASSIRQKCKKTWSEITNLFRSQLYELYTDLLNQFNSHEVICSHEDALNALLSDLQKQLLTDGHDGRLSSAIDVFRKRVIVTKRLERLQSEDVNLKESDLKQMKSPLMCLQEMQQGMKRLDNHIAEYLSQVDNERLEINRALNHLARLTRQSEEQLNDMVRTMKSAQELNLYSQSPARLKVEPLIIPEHEQGPRRSRSQPRMPVVDAISSSSASSDTDLTSDAYIRKDVRRAKNKVIKRDAMVQIGSNSRTVETQHQDGRMEVGRRHSQHTKSSQLASTQPLQRAVQTQIGRSVIDGGVQVDSSSMECYHMEIGGSKKMQRSRSLTSSSDDDDGHEYISEAVPLKENKNRWRRKYTAEAHSGPLSRKKASSLTSLVHSSTQLGIVTNDKASSPVGELGSPEDALYNKSKVLLSSQTQVGPIYSGSERYKYYANYDVSSETGPLKNRINKRVQSGYPCLTNRVNLYCQCDVLGRLTGYEEMETDNHQAQESAKREKMMDTCAQVGVLYSNARQQAHIPVNDVSSASTQIGAVYEEPRGRMYIPSGRRSGLAQTRRKSMCELGSSSTMLEAVPLAANEYVADANVRPQAVSSSTQIGAILSGHSVQTDRYIATDGITQRVQINESQLSRRANSYTQVGQIYRQAEVQNDYMDFNVQPGVVPVVSASLPQEYSTPPQKGNLTGMSVQVTHKMYDDATQMGRILSHNEVQTRDLPSLKIREQDLQVCHVDRQKPKRSSSVPSILFSTETQVGPVLKHERLSPIGEPAYTRSIRSTEVLNVQAVHKAAKSKRIQSVCMPSARDVEMQIGQLLQESETQSTLGPEHFEETLIAPALLSVQQKAISMPNVGVAETQAQPAVHGKKLQVSIAIDESRVEKKHNKKLQVSVSPVRETSDVEVETVPIMGNEHFDVSCDTKIQPENFSKKIQVSLGENVPEIAVISDQGALYAAVPSRSATDLVASAQPNVPAKVTDTACEAITRVKFFDAQCQSDALKPLTQGKKLQVELGAKVTAPDVTDAACDPIDPVKTYGKKMQVGESALGDHAMAKPTKDDAESLIAVERAPLPTYSAPPVQQKTDVCDTACEAMKGYSACDSFAQSVQMTGVGKKLQVAISLETSEQPMYKIASLQAVAKDDYTILTKPTRTQLVHEAPPLKSGVDTMDRECEVLPNIKMFDAVVQSAEMSKPGQRVVGKKLQVTLPVLTASSTQSQVSSLTKPVGSAQAVQTEEVYPVKEMEVPRLQEAPKVYSAAPPPRAATEDRACDAAAAAKVFDAAIQTHDLQVPKPPAVGKKLQVNLTPLTVISSQSTIEVEKPPQTIKVEDTTRVFSAPPQPTVKKIPTSDTACDALSKISLFDAGVQTAEVEKPRAAVLGKKLQVNLAALALTTAQVIYQQPPPPTIRYEEVPTVRSAPSMPAQPTVKKIPTSDTACDALSKISLFDAGVQTAEVEKPRAAVLGKKLQVNLAALALTTAQVIYQQFPPPTIRYEEVPTVRSAPPMPPQPKAKVEDRSCDAIRGFTVFDASVQTSGLQQPKAAVTPGALIVTSSQATGVDVKRAPSVALEVSGAQTFLEPTQVFHVQETSKLFSAPAPQQSIQKEDKACDALGLARSSDACVQFGEIAESKTVAGKKLQVIPAALAVTSSQGYGVVSKATPPLEVSRVQTLQCAVTETPPKVIRVQETQELHAAPPTQRNVLMEDKYCDAIEPMNKFDAGVQTNEVQPAKVLTQGKKLQVSPPALNITSCQVSGDVGAPSRAPAILEVSCVQTFPEMARQAKAFEAPPSQVIQVEKTSNVFAAPPAPKPVAKVPAEDRACEAVTSLTAFDVSLQVNEIPTSKPVMVEKELQASSVPYTFSNVQAVAPGVTEPVTMGKKLQICPPPLKTMVVQCDLGVQSLPPPAIAKVEEKTRVFAAPPPQSKAPLRDAGNDPLELGQSLDVFTQSSPVTIMPLNEASSKPVTSEKNTQVDLHATLAKTTIQTATLKNLNVVSVQSKIFPTGQVATTTQTEIVESPPVMVPEPVRDFTPLHSAPPKPATRECGNDAKPLAEMDVTVVQTDHYKQTTSHVQYELNRPEEIQKKVQVNEAGCDPLPKWTNEIATQLNEVAKIGKKMQVLPPTMEKGMSQTAWEETGGPSVIKAEDTAVVRSAPPVNIRVSTEDMACDPIPSQRCNNAFTQCDPVVTYGKKMQVLPTQLLISTCQTAFAEIPTTPSVIAPREESRQVFAAPPVKMTTTEDKACEPMFKTPVSDFSLQYDAPIRKPSSRSVRTQKNGGAFEGAQSFGSLEHRHSPLPRTIGVDRSIQFQPTTLVGMTQTSTWETNAPFDLHKEIKPSKTTQADLQQVRSEIQTNLFSALPVPPKQPENLFSFVHEAKTKVTSRRSRSGSQGLIPYKTQVFNRPGSLSLSVPAMLNVRTDALSPATVTECYGYSNRATVSQIPRRYASRFRSPSTRGAYGRRNRSMENVYPTGSRTMPRHYISDSDLTRSFRLTQQMEMEQRCEECIAQCVRLIGYDKVAQMLMDTRDAEILGPYDDFESYQAKRRRLQNARTQYTSTTRISCPYCCPASVREVNGRARWPLGAGEEEIYSGEEGYEWDTMQSSHGSAKHGSYRWISRTPVIPAMQSEPTTEEVYQMMKDRSLSAYCSDYELQQSGINANFEENSAFTFVAWKTDHEGEDKLELDTVGHLLRLALVGARVPGTGEVISASDAFYRGILRVIYMDDERGVILPLTTAINANAVIVEKRFSTGIGVAFHRSPRKYPVECTTVWQTPNMRRRTYRVNYIRVSDTERVPVRVAVERGIIDKYSGEIVGVRTPLTAETGDPLLQSRESSVGSGETMERKHRPERFNIREAILNDIVGVDLIQPEIILLPESEMNSATHSRRWEGSVSPSTESNSDLEV